MDPVLTFAATKAEGTEAPVIHLKVSDGHGLTATLHLSIDEAELLTQKLSEALGHEDAPGSSMPSEVYDPLKANTPVKLNLTFLGPGFGYRKGPGTVVLGPGESVTVTTEVLRHTTRLADVKRFWDLERTLNELTIGRVHIELKEG